jgi:hypothetical protein
MRRTTIQLMGDMYHVGQYSPGHNQDSAHGFIMGCRWFDTSASPVNEYVLVDGRSGAAVWRLTTPTFNSIAGVQQLKFTQAIVAGVSTNVVLVLSSGTVLTQVTLEVLVPFSPAGATVTIGDGTTVILEIADSELSGPAIVFDKLAGLSGPASLLTVYSNGPATTGSAILSLFLTTT